MLCIYGLDTKNLRLHGKSTSLLFPNPHKPSLHDSQRVPLIPDLQSHCPLAACAHWFPSTVPVMSQAHTKAIIKTNCYKGNTDKYYNLSPLQCNF